MKNSLHKNIGFSKTNGTSNPASSYQNEHHQATNQCQDEVNAGTYQSTYRKESEQVPNGNMSKERSPQERNEIGKQSNDMINNDIKNTPISDFNKYSTDAG